MLKIAIELNTSKDLYFQAIFYKNTSFYILLYLIIKPRALARGCRIV